MRAIAYPNRHSARQQFWYDPALPFVEIRRACHSRACYKLHAHPTFSIGAVDGGSSIFTGVGGTPVALHPGALVFVLAMDVLMTLLLCNALTLHK